MSWVARVTAYLTSYVNACDVTVASSNDKNFYNFLTCTATSYIILKNSGIPLSLLETWLASRYCSHLIVGILKVPRSISIVLFSFLTVNKL